LLPSPGCPWDGGLGDDGDDLEFAEERLEDDEELKLSAISDHGTFKKTLGSNSLSFEFQKATNNNRFCYWVQTKDG